MPEGSTRFSKGPLAGRRLTPNGCSLYKCTKAFHFSHDFPLGQALPGQDRYILLPPACWNLPRLVGCWFQSFSWSSRECHGGGGVGSGACSSSEITHGTTLLLWHQSKDAWVRGRGGYSHRHRAVRSLLCADKARVVFKYVYSSKSPLHDDSVRSPEDFRCRVKWSHPLDSELLEEATECAAPVPCPCGYSRSPMMWAQPTAQQTPPPPPQQAETSISQPPRDAFAWADAHPSAPSGLHFPHYCNQQNGI